VTEERGRWRFDFPVDADVIVEATYADQPPTPLTLFDVVDRAARGRLPMALCARRGSSFWTMAFAHLPGRSGRQVEARLSDLSELVLAPYWPVERPPEIATKKTTGPFGDRLVRDIQQTTIGGAKARLEAAKRRSGAPEHDLVASARAELLNSDDWPPLLEWMVAEKAAEGNMRCVLASSPRLWTGNPPARWRARQFDALLRAYEEDAGMERRQSHGEPVTFEPLDQAGEHADPSAGTDALIEKLYLADLVARANLTDRQREIWNLHFRDERTDPEIASQLGIAISTVTNTRSQVLEKLRAIA